MSSWYLDYILHNTLTDIVLLISGSLTVLVWSALAVFEIDEYELFLMNSRIFTPDTYSVRIFNMYNNIWGWQ